MLPHSRCTVCGEADDKWFDSETPLSLGYMRSLSDADKSKLIASSNRRCKPAFQNRGVTGDGDEMDDISRDDSKEDGSVNQTKSVNADETHAVVQEVQNPQEQPLEFPYRDCKSRKKRGNRLKQLILNEASNPSESPKSAKEASSHKTVGLTASTPTEGKHSKYNFHNLDFAKIYEYFFNKKELQADEKQWYSSVGLKADSGSLLLCL